MDPLVRRSLIGGAQFIAVMAALLFGSAWSLTYWQGWLFLTVFAACMVVVTLDLLRRDRDLLERRIAAGPAAESEPKQKLIQSLAALCVLGLLVVSALDHRFGWSPVGWPLVLLGEALVIVGYAIIFRVFRENSFASATIGAAEDQTVIDSGPYALVRHPMYAGALVMFVGVPLALGSLWGLALALPLAAVLVWRLVDEERVMLAGLPGYAAYRGKVRNRLIPLVW